MAIIVEPASFDNDDHIAIGRIHVTGWQVAYAGLIPATFLGAMRIDMRQAFWRERLSKCATKDDCEELMVAKSPDGDVVGWIGYGHCRDQGASSSTGEIWGVYVDPLQWSRGAGQALCKTALSRLAQSEYQDVTLWVLERNMRARRFYERLGFRLDGASKTVTIGGEPLEELRYSWSQRGSGAPQGSCKTSAAWKTSP